MQTFYLRKWALIFCSVLVPLASGNKEFRHTNVCFDILSVVSNTSSVSFPGSAQYNNSIEHWTPSSTQPSACTAQPSNAAELGQVLQILARHDTPFGIKSGGHTNNPNFSSTPGVLITTSRFKGVTFDAEAEVATIGVGETWDAVYAELEQYNVTVAGGRVPGVGVGGLIAGGGYSFIVSQVGLGVDTVMAYEFVLPNGTVANITAESDSQLFWALKGSGNNFGVITRVTMKTFPQGPIWGGPITVLGENMDAVLKAVANFDSTVTDQKAGFFFAVQRQISPASLAAIVTVYYDGATPPDGMFDEFLAIPAQATDISTRSLVNLISTQDYPSLPGDQFEQIPISRFPLEVLQAWMAEVENIALAFQNTSAVAVTTVVDRFDRDILTHAAPLDGFETPSAWPATRNFPTFPGAISVVFSDPTDAAAAAQAVTAASDRIRNIAAAAGVTETAVGAPDVAMYPNYAHWSRSPDEIYGSSLPKLRELQKVYDPNGLMKRAGGFKLE